MDTFAATASGVSARLVMAVAMTRRRQGEAWVIKTGDVATAFLHASLPKDRRIYIKPPSTEGAATMWRLKKALYGLRESPRLFQQHLAAVAEQCGWVRGKIDPQLYYHEKTGASSPTIYSLPHHALWRSSCVAILRRISRSSGARRSMRRPGYAIWAKSGSRMLLVTSWSAYHRITGRRCWRRQACQVAVH